MRKFYWLLVLLALTSCKGPGKELSPRDYYILGRDALLNQDNKNALKYFESSLSAAEKIGDAYYKGYACQQLSSLLASQNRYSVAIEYALLAAESLASCGEHVGEALSRLEAARQYIHMDEVDFARAQIDIVYAAFPSPESPMAANIDALYSILEK